MKSFPLYCLRHGQMVLVESGLSGETHQFLTVSDKGTYGMSCVVCHGPFTLSAPPELPEGWELFVTEPSAKELEQMNLNARELLASLMEQGVNL